MRAAYVTSYDVFNHLTWPKDTVGNYNAGYRLAKSLESQSLLLDYTGPLDKNTPIPLISKFKQHFYKRILKKKYRYYAEPFALKHYARQVSKKLSSYNSDVVLCPENFHLISYLECKQPIVLCTDSTYAGLIDFYPEFSNLCSENKRNIYFMERTALDKCKLVIFTTDWAAQTAVKTYEINPSKIRIVPRGVNRECDRTNEDINSIVESRHKNPCQLLFLAVDWFRKGGNIALEVAKELNRIGLPAELLVVGCQPRTSEPLPSFVKTLGFIDKSTAAGRNQINKLLAESHFLILPVSADCSPNVLNEANSFGVPCLTTQVGGIPAIIKDGLNGQTFALNASISEYCTYITSIMDNYSEYKRLALSSFNEYQSRPNWSVVGKTVKQLLLELL